ncbi:MAG: ABC transporter ATP-binding protein [Tenericutes bacterium GWE2_38_8]|nr:MAG: ABC transporter ATP-binding protein [Tenericutes bacterium GWE2_38_8]
MIEVKNMTMKYPSGKGVFSLDFSVKKGEVMGYLGPNGAGKTTTIRALLGFMVPNEGICLIDGLDCFKDATRIQKSLGYIPGEISFFDDMNGDEFLKMLQDLRGIKDTTRQKELLDLFELDPSGKIKKFSKGMKQKLGIVSAFMHNPDVYILDEPTSGLDPIMQNRFIELILEEKKKGKTILMSSHIFEEVEKTCDNVIIIKEGRIVVKSDVHTLKSTQRNGYDFKVKNHVEAVELLKQKGFEAEEQLNNLIRVYVTGDTIDQFFKVLSQFTILEFHEINQTLEDVFMQYYGGEVKSR